MATDYDAIVVGAGALGASTAWHLMASGGRVALVDRGGIAEETSRRAAGMGMQIQADDLLSPIARLGIRKLIGFEAETGQALEVFQPGSLKVARTESDEVQLHDELRRGHELGVEVDDASPEQARRLAPWFEPGSARAIWYSPHDVYLEPADLPRAYVAALRAGGATVLERHAVLCIGVAGGSITHVETDRGRLGTGTVVLAAGAWTPRLAAPLDVRVPMWPIRHELIITEPTPGVTNRQPAVRIMDAKCYVRPCHGGLMFGAYEPDPLQLELREQPERFAVADMPVDAEPLRRRMAEVVGEFPALADAPWAELRGGLPTMTPDGHFLVGPLDAIEGLWMIGGCNVGGLSTSPALGQHLARWIAGGERDDDLAPMDPRRFGRRYDDQERLRRACLATYVDKYSDDEVALR